MRLLREFMDLILFDVHDVIVSEFMCESKFKCVVLLETIW